MFSRLCVLFLLFAMMITITAQENTILDQPAPEFLLRQDNQLLLINGYTGDTTPVPLELEDRDKVEWSPDGTYLLVETPDGDTHRECINLYDVSKNSWIQSDTISCAVEEFLFLPDGSQLFYITGDGFNRVLWQFDIAENKTETIFATTDGDEQYSQGLSGLRLSPSGKYLYFQQYQWIMGGTLNSLVVLNQDTLDKIRVDAPRTYYASYHPIWSPDEEWFLIKLLDEYVTSGTLPRTNHLGDVYLIQSETGEQYRLTHTPTIQERDIHWTDDGEVSFTEVLMNDITLTVAEAKNVEGIPIDKIIQPEPFSYENEIFHSPSLLPSPDPNYDASYSGRRDEDGNHVQVFIIGSYRNIVFETQLPSGVEPESVLIGWRPTDYVYPQG